VGRVVGKVVGLYVGKMVGSVGLAVGLNVGPVGATVGGLVGRRVGAAVGAYEGFEDGSLLGLLEGALDGYLEGARVGSVVGRLVGDGIGSDPSGGQRPLAMLDRLHWWLMRTRDETRTRQSITAADSLSERMTEHPPLCVDGGPICAINAQGMRREWSGVSRSSDRTIAIHYASTCC